MAEGVHQRVAHGLGRAVPYARDVGDRRDVVVVEAVPETEHGARRKGEEYGGIGRHKGGRDQQMRGNCSPIGMGMRAVGITGCSCVTMPMIAGSEDAAGRAVIGRAEKLKGAWIFLRRH